jgi:hypothetical protein
MRAISDFATLLVGWIVAVLASHAQVAPSGSVSRDVVPPRLREMVGTWDVSVVGAARGNHPLRASEKSSTLVTGTPGSRLLWRVCARVFHLPINGSRRLSYADGANVRCLSSRIRHDPLRLPCIPLSFQNVVRSSLTPKRALGVLRGE